MKAGQEFSQKKTQNKTKLLVIVGVAPGKSWWMCWQCALQTNTHIHILYIHTLLTCSHLLAVCSHFSSRWWCRADDCLIEVVWIPRALPDLLLPSAVHTLSADRALSLSDWTEPLSTHLTLSLSCTWLCFHSPFPLFCASWLSLSTLFKQR